VFAFRKRAPSIYVGRGSFQGAHKANRQTTDILSPMPESPMDSPTPTHTDAGSPAPNFTPSAGRRAALGVVVGVLALCVIGGALLLRTLSRSSTGDGVAANGSVASAGPTPASGAAGATMTSDLAVPGRQSIAEIVSQASRFQVAGEYAQAAALLKPLADRAVTDQGVRVAYAQSLLGLKRFSEAYEQYVAAIALLGPEAHPRQGPDGKPLLNVAAAQLHFEAGTCGVKAERPDRAIEHYTAAQLHDPRDARYPLYLGMMHARRVTDQADTEAIAALLRAVKLNPELADSWGTMAEIELRRNKLGLAMQHVQEARRIQPQVLRWRLVEARALNRTGKPQDAIALMGGLSREERFEPAVLSLVAESYGLLQRPSSAAEMYIEAAQSAPTNAEFSYQAALWLSRAGETQRAHNFAQSAAGLGHEGARDLKQTLAAEPSTSPRD
jgi:tetratricopeptide (TPR) repeat protein